MKQILVPTDFSAAAEHAMNYAGNLATLLQASIHLLHLYQVPVSMNEVPVLLLSAEELRQNTIAGLDRVKDLLLAKYPGLTVTVESRMGEVVAGLEDFCEAQEPFCVVLGKRHASGMERFLFGSNTLAVIRNINAPVLVIPEDAALAPIKNIALSVDASGPQAQIEKAKNIALQLGAQLHVIHIQMQETEAQTEMKNRFSSMGIQCTYIHDHEFAHGIETYIAENNIDLLVMLPHHHSFLERLLFKTHTTEVVQKINIPVMSIREN